MLSFRTELEDPFVEKDIIDLEQKIRAFREGKIHEDKFRSLRLARGVYGQRQSGVQMVRIKLPYGKMTFAQWAQICRISDEYSNGNLHLTTRQDIQIHYVSLDKTPELWAKLEEENVTLREACGNTVRNVTASETSGIDPLEAFDVTPHAHAIFSYFLRNPICQEMGRKIKIALSNHEKDTALSYIHDIGLIAKSDENGEKGFKVLVAGGLGAQPKLADVAFEFLPENKIIPFIDALLRVFDRHGERNSRSKARLKFLIGKIGLEAFLALVEQERLALTHTVFEIPELPNSLDLTSIKTAPKVEIQNEEAFQNWRLTNVFHQKQKGYYGVYIRVLLGNIHTVLANKLIESLQGFVADDIRATIQQGIFLRFVPEENLPYVYQALDKLGLASPGATSTAHITACPGTDTCNLAIADSTHLSVALEKMLDEEYAHFVHNNDIKIKISGCMNSCGQHGMAQIGFHGSSLKTADKRVLPAVQVLLGGGTVGNGVGRIAEKVIKVPTKRTPDVIRWVLNDYEANRVEGEYFTDYFDRVGKNYFYELLKPLASIQTLTNEDFIDWGHEESFATAIGVGECAGVMVDLVATLLFESDEKIEWADQALETQAWADAIYHAYASQVNTAKALLLYQEVSCSTQQKVISSFDAHFPSFGGEIEAQILQINKYAPTEGFAKKYRLQASEFLAKAKEWREQQQSTFNV